MWLVTTAEVVGFISVIMFGSEHNTTLPWQARQRLGRTHCPSRLSYSEGESAELIFSCCLSYAHLGWFVDAKTLLACAHFRLDENSHWLSSTRALGTRSACARVCWRRLPRPTPLPDCYLLIALARPLHESSALAQLILATVPGICEFWRWIFWKEARLKYPSLVSNIELAWRLRPTGAWNWNSSWVLVEPRLRCLDRANRSSAELPFLSSISNSVLALLGWQALFWARAGWGRSRIRQTVASFFSVRNDLSGPPTHDSPRQTHLLKYINKRNTRNSSLQLILGGRLHDSNESN